MNTTTRLRRAVVATAGAAALVVGATAAVASGPDTANPTAKGAGPDTAAVSALFPPGSELQFVAVAPCRIVDTRISGTPVHAGSRVFDATLGSYAGQGGKAGTCNLPSSGVVSVQLNLGAISRHHSTSDLKGWATGTAEPTASLVNFNPSGPVANMVTMPVNGSGQFTLKTPGNAHTFIDVAGYFVRPLYAAVSSSGSIYSGIRSGVVSVNHVSPGMYDVRFNRDVQQCSATAASITWNTDLDVSPDVSASADASTVRVGIVDSAGTLTDGYFYVTLTC